MAKKLATKSEIIENIEKFELYLNGKPNKKNFAKKLIAAGQNFIAYKVDGNHHFIPSRYVGHAKATKKNHFKATGDGGNTTISISKKLGQKHQSNTELNQKYHAFCQNLSIKPHKKQSSNPRKFWTLDYPFTKETLAEYHAQLAEKIKQSRNDSSKVRHKRLAKRKKVKPSVKLVQTKVYERNPDVITEVLSRAKGKCEKCNMPAPFRKKKDKTPYLEVHHIVRLADDGDDTIKNAEALCPNCHREKHFG